jgi:hypothetical protein
MKILVWPSYYIFIWIYCMETWWQDNTNYATIIWIIRAQRTKNCIIVLYIHTMYNVHKFNTTISSSPAVGDGEEIVLLLHTKLFQQCSHSQWSSDRIVCMQVMSVLAGLMNWNSFANQNIIWYICVYMRTEKKFDRFGKRRRKRKCWRKKLEWNKSNQNTNGQIIDPILWIVCLSGVYIYRQEEVDFFSSLIELK